MKQLTSLHSSFSTQSSKWNAVQDDLLILDHSRCALFFVFVRSIQWRTLIEPSKYPLSVGDLLFSKRLESVRKDVECFFGILKIRFRILKLAMTYQEQERIDYVFFTCCILHNMLHTFDGMDDLEENVNWVSSAELQSTWEHNVD
ncbi:unnamed protein product, partial [Pylaiella littoralis]